MSRDVTITFEDGSKHVYQGVPDTITPDAIEQRAGAEFSKRITGIDGGRFTQTPGGAAVGNPNLARQVATRPLVGQINDTGLADIATAGGVGAAMGALAPEILTGAGAVAGSMPLTAPMAPTLFQLGTLSRGLGRVTGAGLGAIGGAAGEAGGKVAEALGAGPITAEAARFGAGMIGPSVADIPLWGLKKYLATPALSFISKLRKEVLRKLLGTVEGSPELLTDKEKALYTELTTELRAGPKSDAELERIFDRLDTKATVVRGSAANEATRILTESEREANKTIVDMMRGSIAKRREAIPRLEQIGADALEAAHAKRIGIAPERELSEIGSDLRTVIVKRNEKALEARRAQFAADEAARDAIVQGKESAGQYLEALPEYKSLVQSIEGKLLASKKARMATGTRPVSDPGTERAYQNILDAVSQKRVMVSEAEASEAQAKGLKVIQGTNPATGDPAFYRVFATSFEAIDDVRRKLGTVFSKQPAEGYEAIGADIARQYYAKISDIQKKFAGPPQERLLANYAESTEGMEMFRSKTGKAATAVDKYNDAEFATEAGKLPRRYFASPEGVKALTELTGNRATVVDAAKEYAVNQLRGLSEKQVRNWMTTNRELMRAVPELYRDVAKYADDLTRGERVAASAKRGTELVREFISDQTRAGEAQAGRIRTQGEKAANQVVSEGERFASDLLGDKFPAERVRQLIESGSRKQWDIIAPVLAGNQQARSDLTGAIRQVLADRAEKSVKDLSQFFARNVRPAVEGAQLMSTQQANEIAARLHALENLKVPEQQKLGIGKRLLIQSIGTYSATVAGRLSTGAFDLITGAKEIPQ